MSIYDHVGTRRIPASPPVKVSERGQQLIHSFEGFEAQAYPDPATKADPWTIGYGTTVYPNGKSVRPGDRITAAQAADYFAHDLNAFTRTVLQAVEVPLNQNQLDALVSLTYNIGKQAFRRSTLLRKLNASDYQGAADEFLKWRRANGSVMQGLVNRRTAERKLFLE